MNKTFKLLYSSMNQCNPANRLDSLYWIYSVDNIVVKQEGVSHRYLKVRFFNREFNENENLMLMKFNFHGEEIVVQKFEQVFEFSNPNVLGYIYEIGLTDNSKNISILSYIVNGKEIIPKGKLVEKIVMQEDAEYNIHIIQDFVMENQKNINMYPFIETHYWGCCCGYIAKIKEEKCNVCGRNIKEIKDALVKNVESEILTKLEAQVNFDVNLDFQQQLNSFILNCKDRYGFTVEKVTKSLNIEQLKMKYKEVCRKEISERLADHPIVFNEKASFESNIDTYINSITKMQIQKDLVSEQLDLFTLMEDFNKCVENKKNENEKMKKRFFYIGGVVILSLVVLVAINMIMKPEQKKVSNNKEAVIAEKKKEEPIENYADLSNKKIYAGLYSSYVIDNNDVFATSVTNDVYNNGQSDVSYWSNIIQLSSDQYHTVGLQKGGTVISTKINDSKSDCGQSDVEDWMDIIQVSASTYNTIGLKEDGTVISTYITNDAYDFGQSEVQGWTDIVQVVAAWDHSIGLKKDGTVVTTSINDRGFDYGETNVQEWSDIVEISSASNHTLGLKKDGSVVATGLTEDGRCNVSSWKNIISISTSRHHSLGLKKDGTVIGSSIKEKNDVGQSEVSKWKDIVQISAGWNHSLGLKRDGTMVSTEILDNNMNTGQTNIHDWKFD